MTFKDNVISDTDVFFLDESQIVVAGLLKFEFINRCIADTGQKALYIILIAVATTLQMIIVRRSKIVAYNAA